VAPAEGAPAASAATEKISSCGTLPACSPLNPVPPAAPAGPTSEVPNPIPGAPVTTTPEVPTITTGPVKGETGPSGSGPLDSLGGESKSHPFALDNYGLDAQVNWGITELENTFPKVTQWVIQSIWQLMLYVFNGIMVMLQWAFSLDLLQNSMSKLADALQVMRDHIDTPWGLTAVAAMALWGIWNGLVRKKSIDTLRGLLTSLLCMAALLVVIGNPVGTLGQLTSAANGASTEMLDSITSGSVTEPQQAVGSTEETLFNTVILRPWCALQFGDIDYCLSKPNGLGQSVANTWLQAPPDSEWRKSLYEITKAESADAARSEVKHQDPPGHNGSLGDVYNLGGHADKVELIGSESTMTRLGLLLLILVGVVGAICLFCYLAARLLMAALFVLVLVMFAPAMFLIAALGESGRSSVVAWATRLLGAILTKVVFALFLAVIIAASNLVTDLNLGFFPTWILFIAFWWGVLLKRKDLLALLSLDPKSASPSGIDFNGAAGGHGLSDLYYAKQIAGDVRRGARRVARGATAAPRAAGRWGKDSVARRREAGRAGESDAARLLAREELENEARFALERRYAEEHQADLDKGAPILAQEQQLSSKLADLDFQIGQRRSSVTREQRASGAPESHLLGRLPQERAKVEQDLIALRSSPEFARARSAAGSKPREINHGDVQAWIADRRSELGRGPEEPENLRAAGIDPETFARGSEDEQVVDWAMSRQVMDRHRQLLDRAGIGNNGDDREAMGRRELRQARAEARSDGREDRYREAARERAARRRQSLRNERRSERRRRNVR
jgi:hypothetical protein